MSRLLGDDVKNDRDTARCVERIAVFIERRPLHGHGDLRLPGVALEVIVA